MSEKFLKKFDYCPDYGFVIRDPLERLDAYFDPWTELVLQLDEIRGLEELDTDRLVSLASLRLAHTLLSCLSHSYVFSLPETPATELPSQLAVPWSKVSARLGLPPIILHSTISLSNWRLISSSSPLCLDNLTTLYSLDNSRDLEVFFMVPLLVELRSVPAIKALVRVLTAEDNQSEREVSECLDTVTSSLQEMARELTGIHSRVSPSLFYHKHRVLLSGWRDNPSLPDGLLYQGVSPHPLHLSGGSAAQSSAVQMIDTCLGVDHAQREGEFLRRMRQYMPPNQREMLEELSKLPSMRSVCEGREALERKYNLCLSSLERLRTEHLILVSRYITSQANLDRGRAGHLSEQGTGGTPLSTFLKRIRQDTSDQKF